MVGEGVRVKVSCHGPYERHGPHGTRAVTFGKVILDLITNPLGELIVRGRRYYLAAEELRSPR